MCVGINIDVWNQCITPTNDYQFHLWFPDISMQLNYNNFPLVTLPHLYCLNQQEIKSKYNIDCVKNLINDKSTIYELKKYQAVDINTLDDWKFAEKLYKLN